MRRWLPSTLWLAAWSFWLWLGFGLHRELPRELGPVVCKLPLGDKESPIGFLLGEHKLLTEERFVGKPIIFRIWDAETGAFVRGIAGPVDTGIYDHSSFLEREALILAKSRPPLKGSEPSPGPAVLDLQNAIWRDLPADLQVERTVFHPSKPRAILIVPASEVDKTGRVAVVDLRSGRILFRWNERWKHGPSRELGDDPVFIGESFIGIPTRIRWTEFDYVSDDKLEIWSLPAGSVPWKVIDGLSIGNEPSLSENGRIACDQVGADFVDVYDIHQEAFVFSHPPRAARRPQSGGFGGGWIPARLSQDGRSVLSGMHNKLWDIETGKELWAKRPQDSFITGEEPDKFQLRENWDFGVGKFRRYLETFAVRSLRDGSLLYRCWDTTLRPYDAVSSDGSLIYYAGDEVIRRMPPRPNYPLLALCQTILALPLVLLWTVLRWRRKRRMRLASVTP